MKRLGRTVCYCCHQTEERKIDDIKIENVEDLDYILKVHYECGGYNEFLKDALSDYFEVK